MDDSGFGEPFAVLLMMGVVAIGRELMRLTSAPSVFDACVLDQLGDAIADLAARLRAATCELRVLLHVDAAGASAYNSRRRPVP